MTLLLVWKDKKRQKCGCPKVGKMAIEAILMQKNFHNPAIATCRSKILSYEVIFDQLDDPTFDKEAKKIYLQESNNKKGVLWKFLKVVEVKETIDRLFSEAIDAKSGNCYERLDSQCVEMKTVLEQKGTDGISSIRKEFNEKIEKLIKGISNRNLKKSPSHCRIKTPTVNYRDVGGGSEFS